MRLVGLSLVKAVPPPLPTPAAPPAHPDGADRRAAGDGTAPDHDLLLAAVASRLRACVASWPVAPEAVRDVVHDCALALERLRSGLAHERGDDESVEREMRQLRSALAVAQRDLAGTRDGERRARYLAEHDGLTSLPNRSRFEARLNEALARAGTGAGFQGPRLAVFFLDLDDFKPINDCHGHQTGDELLRIVAQRLRRAVRNEDMVGRLGGDEFACLLSTALSHAQLSQVASKLFDAVSEPLKVGRLTLTVRPSIGIAVYPGDGDSAAALLQHADVAMYRAKRSQSGYGFFAAHSGA